MSRKKIVAANWKMNLSFQEALVLANEIVNSVPEDAITKIIFPSFPYLDKITSITNQRKDFKTGAQNCSQFEKGAYTGEVSALAIQSIGCEYVLVGHSERRTLYNENNAVVKQKLEMAYRNQLIPILCVGENLEQRKNNLQHSVISQQLSETLFQFDNSYISKCIIAYEPVWAIGTGETASPEQAQDVHGFIRNELERLYGKTVAGSMSLVYGGSCNASNAKELFACKDIDGGLIGTASLKTNDFSSIVKSFA